MIRLNQYCILILTLNLFFNKLTSAKLSVSKTKRINANSSNEEIVYQSHFTLLSDNGKSDYNKILTGSENDSKILIENFKKMYPVKEWESNGFFTENYLLKINRHWLKFSPPSKFSHYFLGVLYVILMTTGMLGNALVIFMFIKCKSLRTPANTLVMNLAISDFLMMSKMPVFVYNSIHLGPSLGEIGCKIYGFLGGLTGTVSICTLAAISLDRYYVVKYPLSRRFTNLRAKVCVILCWLYGAVFSTIPLLDLGLGTYVPEGYLTSCSFDYLTQSNKVRIFILTFFTAAWCVPFFLISFCYANIVRVVINSKNIAKGNIIMQESSRHIKEEEKRRQELKLAGVVLLVIGLWFVAWTPYAAVALLGVAGRADLITPIYSMVPALFCKIASCIDPFVYAVTHARFKIEFRALFCNEPLERRSTLRLWTIQTNECRPASLKSRNYRSESQSSEEIIEEEIVLDKKKKQTKYVPSRKSPIGRYSVKPCEPNVLSDMDMKKERSSYKQLWWYRPNFSNRSSSLRGLARTWTARERTRNNSIENEEPKSF